MASNTRRHIRLFLDEKVLATYLKSYVQPQYFVRVEALRDFVLGKYRIGVRVIREDWTLVGELEALVDDFDEFPSEEFKTQLMMVAG